MDDLSAARRARPRARVRRGAARRPSRGAAGRLSRARSGRAVRGGAQLGDRRGPPRRQFRRPARVLPQRARRGRAGRRRPALFRQPLHRPGDPLPRRAGFDHFKVALSVGVMHMVRSDLASSGVIFTLDTEIGLPRRRVRHRRPTVSARTSSRVPSIPMSSTSTSRRSGRATGPCSARELGSKAKYDGASGRAGEPDAQRADRGGRPAALLHQRRGGARSGRSGDRSIEEHYGPTPMDIEWAKDGVDGQLYIVQARPETVASQRSATQLERYERRGTRAGAGEGTCRRRTRRHRAGSSDCIAHRAGGLPARRGPGRRHDRPRTGSR